MDDSCDMLCVAWNGVSYGLQMKDKGLITSTTSARSKRPRKPHLALAHEFLLSFPTTTKYVPEPLAETQPAAPPVFGPPAVSQKAWLKGRERQRSGCVDDAGTTCET